MTRFPLSATELRSVLAPLGQAELLPKAAYLDGSVFELERTLLFDRAWLQVCRSEEVEAPGSFVLAPVTPEGILVTRGADLGLYAHFNVCRHRGALLTREPVGRCEAFVCPYHGWRYELSGRLSSAPGTDALDGFRTAEHGLSCVRVAEWKGNVFVNLWSEAAPLADALAPVPAHLDRLHVGQLRLGRRVEHDVSANWKLLIENFQESHHFSRVHASLERWTPCERSSSFVADGAWLGGTMELVDEAETVSMDGRRHERPLLGGTSEVDRRRVYDYFCWPNLLLSAQPDYLLSYRVWPLSPEKSRVIADVLFHPAAFVDGFEPRDVYEFWDITNREDREICESQQLGLASRGYTRGRYASSEDGTHAFDGRVASFYLDHLEAKADP
ncbi:MAG: aromatic ring-hydroxylating dioxygenase subunit alpha [Myxococcales bacterium]|nr:aromatic ring-hydroxylating dioxygenase subunit alpha [Myxococcales bacterium]